MELGKVTGQTEILVLMKRSSSYVEHVKKYGLKATSRGVRPVSTTLPNPSSTAATAAVATAAAAAPGSAPAAVSVSAAPAIAAVSSRGPTNVAFGVARGACASEGCDCALYRWDAGSGDGGPCQNCLAPDHEILTSEGFVGRCEMEARFEAMLRGGPELLVGAFALQTGEVVFERPSRVVVARQPRQMVSVQGDGVDLLVRA